MNVASIFIMEFSCIEGSRPLADCTVAGYWKGKLLFQFQKLFWKRWERQRKRYLEIKMSFQETTNPCCQKDLCYTNLSATYWCYNTYLLEKLPEPFNKFLFPEIELDCLRAFSVIYESAQIGFFYYSYSDQNSY